MFNPFHNNNQGYNHNGEAGYDNYNHNNYGLNTHGHLPGMGGYGSSHVPGTMGGYGSTHVPGMNGGGYGGVSQFPGTGYGNGYGSGHGHGGHGHNGGFMNHAGGLYKARRHKRHYDDGHSSGSDSD